MLSPEAKAILGPHEAYVPIRILGLFVGWLAQFGYRWDIPEADGDSALVVYQLPLGVSPFQMQHRVECARRQRA